MRIPNCGLVLGLVAAVAATVAAGEKPSAEYAAAMRTLDVAARGLGEALDARDHAAMNEQIILARPAIELVQQYWRARENDNGDQVEDAVDAIRAVSKSVSEISVAVHLLTLSPNPLAIEGAELALTNLHAACAACHAAYRAQQPDGRYLIK
jgi:cytochrome c556